MSLLTRSKPAPQPAPDFPHFNDTPRGREAFDRVQAARAGLTKCERDLQIVMGNLREESNRNRNQERLNATADKLLGITPADVPSPDGMRKEIGRLQHEAAAWRVAIERAERMQSETRIAETSALRERLLPARAAKIAHALQLADQLTAALVDIDDEQEAMNSADYSLSFFRHVAMLPIVADDQGRKYVWAVEAFRNEAREYYGIESVPISSQSR